MRMQPYHYTGKKTWKTPQALDGIQTHDICITGAMLSQLSLIKATWEKSFVGLALYVQYT